MPLITTKSFLVFHRPGSSDICSVPRSPEIAQAKQVPDWVKSTNLWNLALKDGLLTEIFLAPEAVEQLPKPRKPGRPSKNQPEV